jgi:hypothetical protein
VLLFIIDKRSCIGVGVDDQRSWLRIIWTARRATRNMKESAAQPAISELASIHFQIRVTKKVSPRRRSIKVMDGLPTTHPYPNNAFLITYLGGSSAISGA